MTRERDHLAEADQHIRAAKRYIYNQERLIERLADEGQTTDDAFLFDMPALETWQELKGAPVRRYLFQYFPTCLFDMPRLLNVANWSDANPNRLEPHEPEPTDVVVTLGSKH